MSDILYTLNFELYDYLLTFIFHFSSFIFTYLGICYSSLASTTEDNATSKEYYKQAIDAFDKAKELDPDKQMANWGYNRYQAYYGLYGEDDARTKAAEADR